MIKNLIVEDNFPVVSEIEKSVFYINDCKNIDI